MPISSDAIDKFLHKPIPYLPVFKSADPDWLRATIYDVTGAPYKPLTAPRPHQLEGVAFALYQRRCLLYYSMRLGKALRYDCPVATPTGWRPIGELRVGDSVMVPTGSSAKVTGVFPQGQRPMFWVTFTDGAGIACDAEHLWAVNTASRRYQGLPWQVKPLSLIMQDRLRDSGSKGYRYFIPMPEPLNYPEADLPIDPYLLGVLLGDGSLTQITPSVTTDQEIIDKLILPPDVTAKSVPHGSVGIVTTSLSTPRGAPNPLLDALRSLGLAGCSSEDKFIPAQYLTAAVSQRLALLAGLLDTDGGNEGQSNLHWGSVSLRLAHDMQALIRSLGGTAKCNVKPEPKFTYCGEQRTGRPYHHMSVRLPTNLGCPFRLSRKIASWTAFTKFQPQRAIASITPIDAADAVCIQVSTPDGLFVIKDYIVTHNTKMALDWAQQLRLSGHWRGKGLIICHAPIALDVWESEAAKHSRLIVRVVRNQMEELVDALQSDADLIVIPWSGLQNIFHVKRLNKKGKLKLYADLEGLRIAAEAFSLAIIDEIHAAKNPASLRFQIAKELVHHCRHRLGLTGTPMGRNPYDVWSQAYLIDGGKTLGYSFQFFQVAFGVKKNNWFSGQPEYVFDKRKQGLLEEKLSSISLPYKLEECQHVDVLPGTVDLKMVGDQLMAYRECIDKIVKLKDNEETEIRNSFIRLRQISSGYLPFVDNYGNQMVNRFDANAKIEWLTDFLEQIADTGAALLIFHEFTVTGKLISEVLTRRKVRHHWLHGATKDKPGVVREFQAGGVDALIVQVATGSLAIDLHRADYLLFFESPVSPIIRAQAEARPLSSARGQRPLLMDDIACSPVERRIIDYVAAGKDLSSAIIHERKRLGEETHVGKRKS